MSDEMQLQNVLALKPQDEDLLFLNTIVNRTGATIAITLFAKGSVISGDLVPGKQYYNFTADNFKAIGEYGEALSQYFEDKAANQYTSDDKEFEYPNNFLHIGNVCIRNDEGKMGTLNNAMLRIKIEEVEGHVIGKLS